MKKNHTFRPELLVACALMALPLGAIAGDGPYLGVEGGANFERHESSLSDSKFNTGYVGGLTGGYAFESGWRPELELDFRRNRLSAFGGNGNVSGNENAYTAMGNVWYDFNLNREGLAALHPYVGGGLGYAHATVKNFATPAGKPATYIGQNNLFAYQLGAGVGYDLTRDLTVSLDYRLLSSTVGVLRSPPISANVSRRYTAQSLMLGLRYSFGGAMKAMAVAAPVAAAATTAAAATHPAAPACVAPAGFKVDANCHIVEQSLILRGVNFETNSDRMTGPARETLDEVAAGLKGQTGLSVDINGYTDSRGSKAYNRRLSQKRAEAVRRYLIEHGANGADLVAKGFGDANPIASNGTASGRTENRRVEFVVLNKSKTVKVIHERPTAQSRAAAEDAVKAEAPVKKHKKHKKAKKQ